MKLDPTIEFDFVREFSSGEELYRDLTEEQRRERIRITIYRRKLIDEPFRDSGMTYAEAFQKCYGRPLEMRRHLRLVPQSEKSDDA